MFHVYCFLFSVSHCLCNCIKYCKLCLLKNDKLIYYLGFSYFSGIGPVRFDNLISHFGDIEVAYKAPYLELSQVVGQNIALRFCNFRKSFDFENEYKKIINNKITVLTRNDPRFPKSILQISDPPICLYVKGDIKSYNLGEVDNNELYLAIVGTRKPTDYGRYITMKFARELACAGVVIVSGLAMGVDAYAHESALDVGKKTIAFLGCGVNIIYPWANKDLYHKIIDNDGLIISEFPPDKTTLKGHFISRNRLISGLSKGVLVVEGLKDSGALVTARYAIAQGREVFAPPAPITSEQSQAPNLLLKDGAKLVTSVQDILDEFGLKYVTTAQKILPQLKEEHKKLFQLLSHDAFTSDEISRTIRVPISQILTLLSSMEIEGIIEKNESGKYRIRV